ncbi:MAG: FeoB small GTPase domain-containing protein, partial [bacterium]
MIDLPGIYSLYPRTLDEKIVTEIFTHPQHNLYPDKVVLIADATNLKNCLLLLTQLIDLKIPTVLALNMMDLAAKSGLSMDVKKLSKELDMPVVMINARVGHGIADLKKAVLKELRPSSVSVFAIEASIQRVVKLTREHFQLTTDYEAYQYLQQPDNLVSLKAEDREWIKATAKEHQFFAHKFQGAETVTRYGFIQELLNKVVLRKSTREWKKV